VYEPDGNTPPDFLVNGTIAVEVRRLNQNEIIESGHRGLEVTTFPLRDGSCSGLNDQLLIPQGI